MSTINVLLAEDEPTLAFIIKDTLERRDFQVTIAPNGEEALRIFFELKPDILVADIMMPRMDGYTLTKHIRQSDRKTPILFLSARSKTEDVVAGFETGGSDYLKKPFGMEELIVRIKSLLNRMQETPEQAPHIYTVSEYRFNPVNQKLIHPSRTVTLSHRESAILERLCANHNNIVQNKAVLIELWGDDNFFNTRSLHVFIVKLRKHLALDPRIRIVNVRGVGYKLLY